MATKSERENACKVIISASLAASALPDLLDDAMSSLDDDTAQDLFRKIGGTLHSAAEAFALGSHAFDSYTVAPFFQDHSAFKEMTDLWMPWMDGDLGNPSLPGDEMQGQARWWYEKMVAGQARPASDESTSAEFRRVLEFVERRRDEGKTTTPCTVLAYLRHIGTPHDDSEAEEQAARFAKHADAMLGFMATFRGVYGRIARRGENLWGDVARRLRGTAGATLKSVYASERLSKRFLASLLGDKEEDSADLINMMCAEEVAKPQGENADLPMWQRDIEEARLDPLRSPVILHGEPGVGKTYHARQVDALLYSWDKLQELETRASDALKEANGLKEAGKPRRDEQVSAAKSLRRASLRYLKAVQGSCELRRLVLGATESKDADKADKDASKKGNKAGKKGTGVRETLRSELEEALDLLEATRSKSQDDPLFTVSKLLEELMAQARKHECMLVKLNGATLSKEMFESSLFGHKKGAFTGADSDRKGLIEEAKNGGVFIDEAADLDQEKQGSLLELLDEGRKYRALGGRDNQVADCRIILATNKPLKELRPDLRGRIHHKIRIPPLRARKDEISEIITALLADWNQAPGGDLRMLMSQRKLLEQYEWPGNVRQLVAAFRRVAAYHCRTAMASALTAVDVRSVSSRPEIAAGRNIMAETVLQIARDLYEGPVD